MAHLALGRSRNRRFVCGIEADCASERGTSNRGAWLMAGAFSMCVGIWSMHSIGMLAFSLPIRLTYDLGLTFGSLAIAVLTSGFALAIAGHTSLSFMRL